MEKARDDMRNLTKAKVDFYVGEIREKDNEWILEEMEEWGNGVNETYHAMWKGGIITLRDYQEITVIARDGWVTVFKEIAKHES